MKVLLTGLQDQQDSFLLNYLFDQVWDTSHVNPVDPLVLPSLCFPAHYQSSKPFGFQYPNTPSCPYTPPNSGLHVKVPGQENVIVQNI